jgi:hypothetical protein
MEVIESLAGLVLPFIILLFIWKGAKEDWKKA